MDYPVDGSAMTTRLYFNELSWSDRMGLTKSQLDDFVAMLKVLVHDVGVKNIWVGANIKERFASSLEGVEPVLKRKLLPIIYQAFHKLYPIENENDVPKRDVCRYEGNDFSLIEQGNEVISVSKSMLAWSVIRCSPSVALSNSPYDRLHLRVNETDCSTKATEEHRILSLSRREDFEDPAVARWMWAMNPSVDVGKGVHFTDYERKHFAVCHLPRPIVRDWSREEWVRNTKAGAAVFRPGLVPHGNEYMSILHQVLCAAFSQGRYETGDLDGFVCQITEPGLSPEPRNIGAAGGKPTSRVEMYLTDQNVLHLRPKEQA